MSDYLEGQTAARFVQGQVLEETAPYREGYGSAIKASGIVDINALALMQNIKGDRDEDPDGYDLGFGAARETIRQVVAKSAEFRAGFTFVLRVVDTKAEFDAAVTTRVEQKMSDHKVVQSKAARIIAGRRLGTDGIGLTAAYRRAIEVELLVIDKVAEAKDLQQRVQKKLFAAKIKAGTAEFIDSNGAVFKSGEGPTPAQRRMQRIAYFTDTKDAPVLETRDA
jgi:hypothetical protein